MSAQTIGEEGAGHFGVQLGYYDHSDGGGDGNPFLDESLTVLEPLIVFDYNVTDRMTLGATVSWDIVSSASIDRLSDYPEQSGASGDNYIGADFSLLYQKSDNWQIGGHAGYSFEYDYSSLGVGFGANQELPDADASMSYNIDAYFDSIDVIRYNGVEEGSDSRTSVSGSVNWYQILSPKSHGTFGVTLAQQNGFLETPYNSVVYDEALFPTAPSEDTEDLPDSRTRAALFGRVRTSISRDKSWELGGRLYSDTWGISSVALEPRMYMTLIDTKLDLRLRYRFYTQTEADDFEEHYDMPFVGDTDYRTQDSDLAAFDAHTFGTKWTWYRSKADTWDLNLDYTLRSDGLDQIFASIAWRWSF